MREETIIMAPPSAATTWHASLLAAWPALRGELVEEAGRCNADPGELVGCYIDDSICEAPKLEGLSVLARDLMPMMLRDLGQMLPGFEPAVILGILSTPPPAGCVYVFAIINRRPGVCTKGLSTGPAGATA